MIANNCVTSTLAPYLPAAGDWTSAKVAHLYRSFGYGADYDTIQSGLLISPTNLVNQLINEAVNSPQPESYYWSEYTSEDYGEDSDDEQRDNFRQLKYDWTERGFTSPFQQKMTIFWHDHFATEEDVYRCNRYAWRYYKLIHEMAFGNFRSFVEQMGLTEAMLVYLDGNDNRVGAPNENYARELLELFTMGENNGYSQTDIEETAKALTGWRVKRNQCTEAYFQENRFDESVKTIFGQSGNFGYDDVHELIFTLRKTQVAKYICMKLYRQFVYRDADEDIVGELAQIFMDSNWEIVPVLRQLLSSEHFYEETFRGAKIKSPVALTTQLITALGLDLDTDLNPNIFQYIEYINDEMGQDLFNPPNVAGWPGYRFWLSENSLAFRWSYCNNVVNAYIEDTGYEKLRTLALAVSNSDTDPRVITEAFAKHLLDIDLDENLIDIGTLYLKAGIPENYFEDGSWNLYWQEAPEQLLNLYRYLIQIPEYQLS